MTFIVKSPSWPVGAVEIWSIELPEGATGFTVNDATRPGDVDADRAMLSEKPFKPVRVIVMLLGWPRRIVREAGLAEILKSTTLTITVAERDKGPLVPVTVTVKDPESMPVQVKVELADIPKIILAGLREQVIPAEATDCAKLTVPANPATLRTVIAEAPEEPALIVKEIGLVDTVKVG